MEEQKITSLEQKVKHLEDENMRISNTLELLVGKFNALFRTKNITTTNYSDILEAKYLQPIKVFNLTKYQIAHRNDENSDCDDDDTTKVDVEFYNYFIDYDEVGCAHGFYEGQIFLTPEAIRDKVIDETYAARNLDEIRAEAHQINIEYLS